MALNIAAKWLTPFSIREGGKQDQWPWMCDQLELIPEAPGIYVFGRKHGKNFEPHYVGKATDLQQRVGQQLRTNVALIKALGDAKNGARQVHVCILRGKRGQQQDKALALMESGVIRAALAAGHMLLNVQGTRQITHQICFTGNRVGTSISGKTVRVPVRGQGG